LLPDLRGGQAWIKIGVVDVVGALLEKNFADK
jgi:hypothetical protein